MEPTSAFSPTLRGGAAKSPTIVRVPRDEQLRIPGRPIKQSRRQAPVPLRPLRQPPAPPATVPARQLQNIFDDHGLKSPEIVDFDHGQENAGQELSRKKSQDSRRLTDHSERAYDILNYYLNSHTPNPPPTPAPKDNSEPVIAEFDFGFSPARSEREQSAQKTSPASSPNKPLPNAPAPATSQTQSVDDAVQQITSTRSGHRKTYSLFPVMQPMTTREPLPRTSSDTRVLSQSFELVTPLPLTNTRGPFSRTSSETRPLIQPLTIETPMRPRKASIPISIRTRADSGTMISMSAGLTSPISSTQLPRRPQTVRIRTSTSSSSSPTTTSNSTTTPHRSSTNTGPSSRWSEDTVTALISPTQSITSSTRPFSTANHKSHNSNSVNSTWTESTVRESIEPLYPPLVMQSGEQLVSFFEDDDDDDEERPLRWKWKRSSGEKTERAKLKKDVRRKSWSPRSSTRSRATIVTVESLGGRDAGWKRVLCCGE
ncbi:hypothetical protein MBLNU457_4156t2 [Dothideomycetes sp. NU457]